MATNGQKPQPKSDRQNKVLVPASRNCSAYSSLANQMQLRRCCASVSISIDFIRVNSWDKHMFKIVVVPLVCMANRPILLQPFDRFFFMSALDSLERLQSFDQHLIEIQGKLPSSF